MTAWVDRCVGTPQSHHLGCDAERLAAINKRARQRALHVLQLMALYTHDYGWQSGMLEDGT